MNSANPAQQPTTANTNSANPAQQPTTANTNSANPAQQPTTANTNSANPAQQPTTANTNSANPAQQPTTANAKNSPQPDPESPSLISMLTADTGPARECAEAAGPDRIATPATLAIGGSHLRIRRTFCFVDLSGFTAYTETHGPHEAVKRLGEFREVNRNVAARRGVRLAKWLGDGAMAVGTEPTPTIAFGAHLMHHFSDTDIAVRVGVASGEVLLFEGNDYIGGPVNLAALLCAGAQPKEMLTVADEGDLPSWVSYTVVPEMKIKGMGALDYVKRITLDLSS